MRQFFFAILMCCSISLVANPPEELGKVNWIRNLDQALSLAKKEHKPILILFQEVPGCLTCKQYGRVVLSHPLIVEAIEDNFIPLAIYNNKGGTDASVLQYFNEPSWNNPVVRMISADKKNIQPRLNGKYKPSELVDYLMGGLRLQGLKVPAYMHLLYDALKAEEGGLEKTTLSMYCFWTGEKILGNLDGVIKTEAGFMDHREVVNVYYDPKKISLSDIVFEGKKNNCADAAYITKRDDKQALRKLISDNQIRDVETFRMDKQPKYYLSHTLLASIPMMPIQAVKINAAIGAQKDPLSMLSPRQLKIYHQLKKQEKNQWNSFPHDAGWQDKMFIAWEVLQ